LTEFVISGQIRQIKFQSTLKNQMF